VTQTNYSPPAQWRDVFICGRLSASYMTTFKLSDLRRSLWCQRVQPGTYWLRQTDRQTDTRGLDSLHD